MKMKTQPPTGQSDVDRRFSKIHAEFPTPESLREANKSGSKRTSQPLTDANGLPLPCPSPLTKADIFQLSDYAAIDDRACKAPAGLLPKPLKDLVHYLVQPTKNDELGMVRAIYRWITAQNPSVHAGASSSNLETAFDYLIGIKNKKVNYHRLMQDMCRIVDIQTTEITGCSKHARHEIGDSLDDSNHSWTAVLINNAWHLIDVHWSSSQVSGIESDEWLLLDDNGQGAKEVVKEKEQVHYKYDEAWFLTNPEEMIYSHFPTDQQWQLLARPVSLDEFTQMAYLKSEFFKYRLCMKSHKKCVEYAPEGEIEIELGQPPDAHYRFMYRLWISKKGEKAMSSEHLGKNLKRFVFMENNNGTLVCKIQFPIAEKFKLELYCKDKSVSQFYKFVCAYVIVAEKAKENARAYPENPGDEWGPGSDLIEAGLRPITHSDGTVVLKKGETEIRFLAEKSVEVLVDISSNTKTKKELEGYIVHRKQDEQVIVNIKVPEPGDYALSLFAKDKNVDGSFPRVCTYLLSASEAPDDKSPYPAVPNGRLGPTDEFVVLGMEAVSHPSALFVAPGSGQVDLTFRTPLPCDLLTELRLCGEEMDEENMDDFTFVERDDKQMAKIRTRFPKKGKYALKIYGKQKDNEGSFPCIFTYIIIVNNPMKQCYRFPKAFNAWTDGCELHKPDTRTALTAGSKLPFSVRIPNAVGVALISSTKVWTHLSKEDDDYWTGEVDNVEPGELKLSACFTSSSEIYNGLLIFQVDEPKKTEILTAQPEKSSNESQTARADSTEASKREAELRKRKLEEEKKQQQQKREMEEQENIKREEERRRKQREEEEQEEIRREEDRLRKQRENEEIEKMKWEDERRRKQQKDEEEKQRRREEEKLERERQSGVETKENTEDLSEGTDTGANQDEMQATFRNDDEVVDGREHSRQVNGKKSPVIKRTKRRAKKDANDEQQTNEINENTRQARNTEKHRSRKKEQETQEQKEKEQAEMRRRKREEKRQKIRMWDEQFETEKLREEMGEKEYRRQVYMERRTAVLVFMQTIETKTVQKNVKKTA